MGSTGEYKNKSKPADTVEEYDDIPYPSYPYPDTHPNKLSSMATMFGIKSAPVNKCRVLELGCGSATNLIDMAAGLPDSEFIGVDLAENEIKIAQKKLSALKLSNIEVSHKSITDIDKTYGKFDYIICHGIYSWVPEEVRVKILEICRDNLNPNGIAYISYNAYPSWHMLEIVREMMLYHVRNIKNRIEAAAEARKFLKFMAESSPDSTPYGMLLKTEAKRVQNFSDDYFLHDQLGEINQPFYFHEFAESLAKNKLQYLCECDFLATLPRNYSQEVIDTIASFGENDVVSTEQYLDFIMNRMFRKTLICHADVEPIRLIKPEVIKNLFFISSLSPKVEPVDLNTDSECEFNSPTGARSLSTSPISKALWEFMRANYPKPANLITLMNGVKSTLTQAKSEAVNTIDDDKVTVQILAELLLGFSVGYISTYSQPLPMTLTVSEHPVVAPFVRYDAKIQKSVTNQLHERIEIDNVLHHILPRLDGTNDIESLIVFLIGLVKEKKMTIKKNGTPITDPKELRTRLLPQLEKILHGLGKQGLLIG